MSRERPDREEVEERAAIVAEGCKVDRERAEKATARQYGYDSWAEMMEDITHDQ